MPTLILDEPIATKKPTLVLDEPETSAASVPDVDFNSVLDFSSRYELPPEDVEGLYGPLRAMTNAVADPTDVDISPAVLPAAEELPKIGAAPEKKKTFLESVLGFSFPAKPPGWDYASPIEKFNFATLPIADFLGRVGGKITSDWRLTKREDVQKILASEYHDTLKFYQKTPELLGWTGEQIAEYALLRTVFAVSGLSNVLTGAGQKISQPFVSKALTSAGGAELKTLSGAGVRNLLQQGLINFLQSAPENVTFVGSWSGLDCALRGGTPKEISIAAAKGARWGAALTAGMGFLAPLTKTPEAQTAFQGAVAYLARKYPRTVDFLSKDIEPEILDQTVKLYGEQIGQDVRFTELPANVQAAFRNAARALKKELVKAAQKEDALKTYWSSKVKVVPSRAVTPEGPPEAVPSAAIITPPPVTLEQEIFERIVNPIKLAPPTKPAEPTVTAPPTGEVAAAKQPSYSAKEIQGMESELKKVSDMTEKEYQYWRAHDDKGRRLDSDDLRTYVSRDVFIEQSKKNLATLTAPPAGIEVAGKTVEKAIYTSVPKEWRGRTLYDWGRKGLRGVRKGEPAIKAEGQRPRKSFIWANEFGEIPARTPKVLAALREKTDEIFYVKSRKGNYYLAPKPAIAQVKTELGEDAFKQNPKPVRSPLQRVNDRLNSALQQKLDDVEGGVGESLIPLIDELGLTKDQLSDKVRGYIEEYENAKARGTIREDRIGAVESEIPTAKTPEELAERQSIEEEHLAEDVGDFLDGLTEPERPEELLGGPTLRPGFVELPPQLQDIVESVKENVSAIGKDIGDVVKSLEFYPDLPNDLRNDIRVDVVGAISKARDDVYSKIANYLWGGMKDADIQKSVEIIFARDQVSRTQLGKGNPEIGLEDTYGFLDDAMAEASPEVVAAADKWRTVNQKFRDKLVERGLLDEEQLIEDYAPHFVLDYTPDWKFNVGIPTRLKRPFRGYVKKAHGTVKEYQQDKDALLGSLLVQQHDNIIEDFIEKQCEKYNVLTALSKEQKAGLFGTDKAGRARPPKPGRIYEIEGKRYRGYTPDIPFTRQLFPTEEGLMALGRYKNVSLIPENIYNLFKEFSERGSRPVYLINRITSIWKSMAILSHFPSFNVNNMVGDTWMAASQHPDPIKLFAEYPAAIQYLYEVMTGKEISPQFADLHKFVIDQDVLTGTFAASEMAQMRTAENPVAWLLEKTQEFSNFREGINRTAYALTLLKAKEAGDAEQMIKAHDWINTEDLAEDAALGKIARDVLVDYGAASKDFRRFIRGGVAPFATWYVKGSKLIWSWALKHWGKALTVFMGVPIAAEIYNHRTDDINELEKQLPDYVRNRTHLVLGENPDGTIRVWSFQLPQDALIGTKIFSILTDYANRVFNKEMTADEAALKCLRTWGIKEAKGLAFLTGPLIRYFSGLMTPTHKDPYDGAPIYTTDPAKMTWFDRRQDEALYFLKTAVPFLSVSIGAYEKGQPTDIALKNLLDRFAGLGALGIYDVSKQGKLVIERGGQKFEFDYDDVARIQYIAAKEERYLDKIERGFVASGLSPDKFAETSGCYNRLDDIYELWSKFEPSLKAQQFGSNQEKAHAIMNVLGERFVNRLTDFSVVKRWYNAKLARADTDAEKVALRKEMDQIQAVQMVQTLKRLPQSARTVGINAVFQQSELPWELILTLPGTIKPLP
jgi:hypothetical protein